MKIQDEFKFFMENCSKASGSFDHYKGGLKTFVSERLKVLVEGFTDIFDYTDPEVVEDFLNKLEADEVFNERDKSQRGGRMYSNSIASYLMFLRARQFFSSPKEETASIPMEQTTSLQRIYYGAPGTGKSHSVNELTEGESVIRTTFHPDSDYSTFVGAYKPTMSKTIENILSIDELKEKLRAQKSRQEAYPCHIFAVQYWYSLSKINADDIKNILVDCGFTESMYNEILKGIAIGKWMAGFKEDKIIYEFVPQAFLQAYVKAWKYSAEAEDGKPKRQFLVVEEINRGNCAQIFGDLFQLLDRNDSGFSEYPINADKDLQTYLAREFEGMDIRQKDSIDGLYKTNVVDKVLSGEILLLPNNLYIWATMNTSDQSLFPIDSAFKRRWDWMYVPIANALKGWKIEVGKGVYYDWWDFLEKINRHIYATTNSADKQLGYFFCKANDRNIISAETFVNKVIFYLWNDVFKDFGFDATIFADNDDKENSRLTFGKFYSGGKDGSASVVAGKVAVFMDNLEVKKFIESVDDNHIEKAE